ncbi:MAG: ABC transporter ATP-binding protein [Lactobacillus sp.]|jgi:ABC-2 type transport system ATP-binding protein|nr:ABC transporter ATP-binding protein [Lactobacillus sp.]
MLQVNDLTVQYDGVPAIQKVTFTLAPGHIYALLGKNGSGKTTLMEAMMTMLQPSSGTMLFNDQPVTGDVAHQYFGYMASKPFFYEYLTVLEFLQYIRDIRELQQSDAQILDYLATVNLEAKKDALISTLSGGMRQRLSFVVATLHQPAVLLLDEPFSGQDPDETLKLQQLVTAMAQNTAILISTHVFALIDKIATDVIFLTNGTIQEIQDVAQNPWDLATYEAHFAANNQDTAKD